MVLTVEGNETSDVAGVESEVLEAIARTMDLIDMDDLDNYEYTVDDDSRRRSLRRQLLALGTISSALVMSPTEKG